MREELIRLIPPAVSNGYEVEYHLRRGTQGSLTITRPPAEAGIFDLTTAQAQLSVHPSAGLLELQLRQLKGDQWTPWSSYHAFAKLIARHLLDDDNDTPWGAWAILAAVIDDYAGG